MIDSLVHYSSNTTIRTRKNGLLYYYMRMASGLYTVDFNKASLNQLINSGNLRYFTNPDLITLISSYNTSSTLITDLGQDIEINRNRAFSYRDQIIKAQYALQFGKLNMDMLLDGTHTSLIDSLRNTDFTLQSDNPDLLNSYANALIGTKGLRGFLNNRYYPKALREATDIMKLLKKEYNL